MSAIKIIQEQDYLRQRSDPRPGDLAYLHLSDVLLALEPYRTEEFLRVLDFGSGGSPYRSLFPNSDYRRADFIGGDGLNYVIDEQSRIPEPNESFDLILSTQVLEHCIDAAAYLAECRRLLRPGGRLLCSTHGTFEDHGCPHDYQRWTADGLKRDLESSGFKIANLVRLTVGPRALLFLLERIRFATKNISILGVLGWLLRRIIKSFRARLHKTADKVWGHFRIKQHGNNGDLYIALFVVAEKS